MADISYSEVITSTGTLPDGQTIVSTGTLPENVVNSINSKLDGIRKIDKKLGASVFDTSLGSNYTKGEAHLNTIASAGFDKAVICVHDRYQPFDASAKDYDADTATVEWYFPISVDELESLVNYARSLGLAVSVKIHTKFANDIAGGKLEKQKFDDELVQRQHMENWMAHHWDYLTELVTKNLDIEWISDFNESGAIPNYTHTNAEGVTLSGKEFMEKCIYLLKWGVEPPETRTERHFEKVGISFNQNTFKETEKAGEDLINQCDFIALNSYPPVGYSDVFNAKMLTTAQMIDAFSWTDLNGYLKWMYRKYVEPVLASNTTGPREIFITEIGCGRYWDMYNDPHHNTQSQDTNMNSNYESTAKYMDAITEYLVPSVVKEINYWYTTPESLQNSKVVNVVAKWKGEKL